MTLSLTGLIAPAKLNLFLHITGQRDDGYHQLQTVFQLLDFGDKLNITRRDDGFIRLINPIDKIPSEDNLVYKAATLLQKHTKCAYGADIELIKQIPMGAGLGGGSSDAASTLLALNTLWDTQQSNEQLAQIGLTLGADVPVFIYGNTAWAEGIGEQLSPVKTANDWFLVLVPPCHISTQEIFSHKDLTRNTSPIRIAAFLNEDSLNSCLKNDCQSIVEQLYPDVKSALKWLEQFAPCQLTGTGSAIFARFDSEQEARNVEVNLSNDLPKEFFGFVTQGVSKSPTLLQITNNSKLRPSHDVTSAGKYRQK